MKILYAIQATGNGHISRAIEIMPALQKYGHVDVFLSGNNSSLPTPFNVKYKSKGLSLFYGNTGGLDYFKIAKSFAPLKIFKEAKNLPVEKYDIVINDFESITTLACWLKKVPCVHFGHQASFNSPHTPRPEKIDKIGDLVLRNYAGGTANIGLHFEQYDDFIFAPILKQSIIDAEPINNKHITVYLSHYSDEVVATALHKIKDVRFEVFSKKATSTVVKDNVTFIPVSNDGFNKSMISSEGVITGAGFETPAEALYLGKKLLCLPIQGQYEQLCNAAALANFNVHIVKNIDEHFTSHVQSWLQSASPKKLVLEQSTNYILNHVIETGLALQKNKKHFSLENLLQPDDVFSLQRPQFG